MVADGVVADGAETEHIERSGFVQGAQHGCHSFAGGDIEVEPAKGRCWGVGGHSEAAAAVSLVRLTRLWPF